MSGAGNAIPKIINHFARKYWHNPRFSALILSRSRIDIPVVRRNAVMKPKKIGGLGRSGPWIWEDDNSSDQADQPYDSGNDRYDDRDEIEEERQRRAVLIQRLEIEKKRLEIDKLKTEIEQNQNRYADPMNTKTDFVYDPSTEKPMKYPNPEENYQNALNLIRNTLNIKPRQINQEDYNKKRFILFAFFIIAALVVLLLYFYGFFGKM